MLRQLDIIFAGKPTWLIIGASFVLILLLASIDHLGGNELSFSVFYLIPISIAAWYGGRKPGYIASGASAAAWVLVERVSSQVYSQFWILYWNATVRLVFFVVVAWLITELTAHLVRQQQLARTDDLTGVLNRAGFIDRAGAVISAAARYGNAFAIAYIDLDGFKLINDTLGHSHGDDVLRAVGGLLDRSSRESDIVARMGGDEFAVLLPNTNVSGAQFYFDNLHSLLLQEIRQKGWEKLGVSIGAAVFDGRSADLADALQAADGLMYRAKRSDSAGVIVEAAS